MMGHGFGVSLVLHGRVRALGLGGLLLSVGCSDGPQGPAAAAVACTEDAELGCTRPVFNVFSLSGSQSYYRDVLGFSLDWQDGAPPDFASVSRSHATLFLCEGCQGTPGAWAVIFAKDVDALYAEVEAKGARIRMRPKTMPWGFRELHVADPDGNVIRFATGVED